MLHHQGLVVQRVVERLLLERVRLFHRFLDQSRVLQKLARLHLLVQHLRNALLRVEGRLCVLDASLLNFTRVQRRRIDLITQHLLCRRQNRVFTVHVDNVRRLR